MWQNGALAVRRFGPLSHERVVSPNTGESEHRHERSEDLLSRFAEGDDSVLGRLLDREAPWIVQRLRARLPSDLKARLGASDILQLTAIDLMRLRGRFLNQGVPAFRGLVATIADNALSKAVDRERAQKRSPEWELPPVPTHAHTSRASRVAAIDTHTPSRDADRTESVDRLQACLAQLPEADRILLRMIDYDGLSYGETAAKLKISISAAHKRHGRALVRLRGLMGRR